MIHGPAGSGKTVLVATLCELQAIRVPMSKTFIACSSNSACDAVVPKFEHSQLMVVRAHGLSLERETLLKDYFGKKRSGKLREADPLPEGYEPPPRPQKAQVTIDPAEGEMVERGAAVEEEDEDPSGDTNAPENHEIEGEDQKDEEPSEEDQSEAGFDGEAVSDELMLKATLDIMKLCEERYQSRVGLFNPTDPRMYEKTKVQLLNEDEWARLKKGMEELAQTVLRAADVVIATAVQGEMDLLKDIVFNQVIMDEISVATHAELLCCWRGVETVTLVGDPKQLPATVLTTQDYNPFVNIQSHGPFQRWSELGMPVFLLKQVMRMTAGLEDISNTIFYDKKLVRGPGTSLDDPKRKMSCRLLPMIQKVLPKLTSEPHGLVYPVFFNVRGSCRKEENGSSRVNYHNIAFIVDWVKKLLSKIALGLSSSDFGIACPYSGQRRQMRKALINAKLHNIRVGTTEYWQGKEASIMVVDFVRARNDNGSLGFLVKKERLNVLLTRQQQHLFVVGDVTCCETLSAAVDDLFIEDTNTAAANASSSTGANPPAVAGASATTDADTSNPPVANVPAIGIPEEVDAPAATKDRQNVFVVKVLN